VSVTRRRQLLPGLVLSCCLLSVPAPRHEAHAGPVAAPYVVAYSAPAGTTADRAGIVALRADGGDRLRLSSADSLDQPVSWSPDGSRLTFERIDATHVYTSVWTVGLDGARPVPLGSSPYDERPVWSPDGSLIAYQEQTDFGSGGGRADTSFDLWVVRPDGSSPVTLDTGGTSGSSAEWVGDGDGWDWSPDSRRIAVVEPDPTARDPATGENHQRLGVLDVAARRVRVRVPLSDSFPDVWGGWAWSPDGRRIAFVKPGNGRRTGILDVTRRALVATTSVAAGDVSYQGSRLPLATYGIGWAWLGPGRLAALQTDRSKPRRLRLAVVDAATGKSWQIPVTLSTRVIATTSLVTQFISSASGRQIAVFADRPGSAVPSVVVADLVRQTTRSLGAGTAADWSPDGRRIAVVVAASTRMGCGDLRIVALPGGHASRVARPPGACDGLPRWSDDGSELIFTRSQGAVDTVLAVAADGSGLRALLPVSASAVVWPDDCGRAFVYGPGWLLPDDTGAFQLVRRPQLPASSVQAWRC
jgi:Tol biopolymer transport system component